MFTITSATLVSSSLKKPGSLERSSSFNGESMPEIVQEPASIRIARICARRMALDQVKTDQTQSPLDTFKDRISQKLESAESEITQMCSSSLEQETVRSQQSLIRLDAIATRDRSTTIALSERINVVQAKDEQQVDDLMARLDALEIASQKGMQAVLEAIEAVARGDEKSLCELTSLIEDRFAFFSSAISEFEKIMCMQIAALEKEDQVQLGAVRNGLDSLHQGIALLEKHFECVKAQQNSVSRQIDAVGKLEQALQQGIIEVKLAIEEARERKEAAQQMRIIGTIACVALGGLAAYAYASGTALGVAAGDAMMLGGVEIKFGLSLATGGAVLLGSQLSSDSPKERDFKTYQERQKEMTSESESYLKPMSPPVERIQWMIKHNKPSSNIAEITTPPTLHPLTDAAQEYTLDLTRGAVGKIVAKTEPGRQANRFEKWYEKSREALDLTQPNSVRHAVLSGGSQVAVSEALGQILPGRLPAFVVLATAKFVSRAAQIVEPDVQKILDDPSVQEVFMKCHEVQGLDCMTPGHMAAATAAMLEAAQIPYDTFQATHKTLTRLAEGVCDKVGITDASVKQFIKGLIETAKTLEKYE